MEQLEDILLDNIHKIDHTWSEIGHVVRTTGTEICRNFSGKRKNRKETWLWNEEKKS